MMVILLLIILELGILVLNWDRVRICAAFLKNKFEIWADSFKNDKGAEKQERPHDGVHKLAVHLIFLLRITLGMGTMKSCKTFLIFSAGTSLTVTAYLLVRISLIPALAAGIGTAALPYLMLRARLQKIRVESSREGEIMVTELLNYYKICYYNMQQAIETAAMVMDEAPVSKQIFMNLSAGLNKAGSDGEIRRLLTEFRFSVNTSWGNVLASNMYFALSSGTVVADALGDLADTIKSARKVAEYSKRENNEAVMMLKYLAPIAYCFTVVAAINFFGISREKFLYYQFGTEVGMTWFVIFIVLYMGGLLLNSFVQKTKLDF